MTHVKGLLVCISLVGICLAVDEGKEPPLICTLTIDGKTHELIPGTPLQLRGTYKNPTILLNTSPTRKFSCGGVEFLYPAAFGWEADITGPNDRSWTLSGNDFTIMYFVSSGALTAESQAEGMAEQFGKANTRISDTQRKLGERSFKGKQVLAKLVGATLTQEIYVLPAKKGSRLLVLQDSPPDDKPRSAEAKKVLAMLETTFKLTAMPNKAKATDGK